MIRNWLVTRDPFIKIMILQFQQFGIGLELCTGKLIQIGISKFAQKQIHFLGPAMPAAKEQFFPQFLI